MLERMHQPPPFLLGDLMDGSVRVKVRRIHHRIDQLSRQEVMQRILQLFPDARILEHKPLRWHCDCSKEHFADALAGLQKSDLEAMINEDHGAEAECHYCRKKYRFTEEELREILEKKTRA
jgi:molecular chaperone Hsp33